ncbi:MAG: hypothetical protein M0P71_04975 [Melioribacteraceae bacterium]|nr:hypothetical protein [Melioribacteraceae bacterium]
MKKQKKEISLLVLISYLHLIGAITLHVHFSNLLLIPTLIDNSKETNVLFSHPKAYCSLVQSVANQSAIENNFEPIESIEIPIFNIVLLNSKDVFQRDFNLNNHFRAPPTI